MLELLLANSRSSQFIETDPEFCMKLMDGKYTLSFGVIKLHVFPALISVNRLLKPNCYERLGKLVYNNIIGKSPLILISPI